MKHEFELWKPNGSALDGRVIWDDEAGTLSGDRAELLHRYIKAAIADGHVIGAPMPTSYDITDPLHDAAQLGAVIGTAWMIPPLLVAAMIKVTGPEEVINAPVLY